MAEIKDRIKRIHLINYSLFEIVSLFSLFLHVGRRGIPSGIIKVGVPRHIKATFAYKYPSADINSRIIRGLFIFGDDGPGRVVVEKVVEKNY